jgi:hypothetical protein
VGLRFPRDLEAWRSWQARRQPVTRRLRARATRRLERFGKERSIWVTSTPGEGDGNLIVVLDSRSPTAVHALVAPLRHLGRPGVTVLSAAPVADLLPAAPWTARTRPLTDAVADVVDGSSTVLTLGHYLPIANTAYAVARAREARFLTVQHGLLTPLAPPLAPGTSLLAWSDADAEFWTAGRDDVESAVVGSELLWQAGTPRPATAEPGPRRSSVPVYLGQLHAAELSRSGLVASAEAFCRAEGARYRPHPAEADRRSRATHDRWARDGVAIERDPIPLKDLEAPVVSVFSTGTLEAAARGLPAWVHYLDPPSWLEEFWDRYRLSRWGTEPTPAPTRTSASPAEAVAAAVSGLGGMRQR